MQFYLLDFMFTRTGPFKNTKSKFHCVRFNFYEKMPIWPLITIFTLMEDSPWVDPSPNLKCVSQGKMYLSKSKKSPTENIC